jgi:hypothetical protein
MNDLSIWLHVLPISSDVESRVLVHITHCVLKILCAKHDNLATMSVAPSEFCKER